MVREKELRCVSRQTLLAWPHCRCDLLSRWRRTPTELWMNQFDISAIFEGKVVATNSASSDMLSVAFWTCDWREVHEGFSILPIKFIPHYQSNFGDDDPRGPIDWQKAYDQLANYGDANLPILALREG